VALDALDRIDAEGSYANLVLDAMLSSSELSERDRRFATNLVYGTTRMRRACRRFWMSSRRGMGRRMRRWR
jgi:16S rRNA (cytosine967-C5)-methyltransferase